MFAFSRDLFVHVSEHRDVFRAMVGRRSGALIQQLFHKMLMELVREDVKGVVSRRDAAVVPTEAIVQFVAGGLFGLVLWWVDARVRLSVDDLNALWRQLVVAPRKATVLLTTAPKHLPRAQRATFDLRATTRRYS